MIMSVGKAIYDKIKNWVFLPLLLFSSLFAEEEFSLVLVHIGDKIPSYAHIALEQARLFNKNCPIVFIGNRIALEQEREKLDALNILQIPYESLKQTREHQSFLHTSKLEQRNKKALFYCAAERFFCLYDYMQENKKEHVFHIEYDNTLYCDLSQILPIFKQEYKNAIGATFDNDQRCIAGFIYLSNSEAAKKLIFAFQKFSSQKYDDMQVLGLCNTLFKNPVIKNLPIISDNFTKYHNLRSTIGLTTTKSENYWHCFQQFQSIFDAAAIGQYLGGTNLRNEATKPGFINESSLMNPSDFLYKWEEDAEGRKCPYAFDGYSWIKINNLHIHSKQLHLFKS